jgi:hypothetical protein
MTTASLKSAIRENLEVAADYFRSGEYGEAFELFGDIQKMTSSDVGMPYEHFAAFIGRVKSGHFIYREEIALYNQLPDGSVSKKYRASINHPINWLAKPFSDLNLPTQLTHSYFGKYQRYEGLSIVRPEDWLANEENQNDLPAVLKNALKVYATEDPEACLNTLLKIHREQRFPFYILAPCFNIVMPIMTSGNVADIVKLDKIASYLLGNDMSADRIPVNVYGNFSIALAQFAIKTGQAFKDLEKPEQDGTLDREDYRYNVMAALACFARAYSYVQHWGVEESDQLADEARSKFLELWHGLPVQTQFDIGRKCLKQPQWDYIFAGVKITEIRTFPSDVIEPFNEFKNSELNSGDKPPRPDQSKFDFLEVLLSESHYRH